MYHAYIKTDENEDPEVLCDLCSKLSSQNIIPKLTDKKWDEIESPVPFLYFRNAYLRLSNDLAILKFHFKHKNLHYLTASREVISVNPNGKPGTSAKCGGTYFKRPAIEALPILLGTHQRPAYLRLTLNSLLHNLRFSEERIYIVASQPDKETKAFIENIIKNTSTPIALKAVFTENNLKYAFSNFGAKFFGLEKFIHFEDDGILPEHTFGKLPFWTRQLNHRYTGNNLVALKTFEGNWDSLFYLSTFYHNSKLVDIPSDELWFYTKPGKNLITPFGGNGIVIDSKRMYKNFRPPQYRTSDHHIYNSSDSICIANIPLYHIGANSKMDYPMYFQNKFKDIPIAQKQVGTDFKTGETKEIDLALDWEHYSKPSISQDS